jgi:superfamily I DNA/RNA helicase
LDDTEVKYICDILSKIDIKIKSVSNLITEFIKIFPEFKDIQNKKEEYKTIQQLLSTVIRFDNTHDGIKQSIEYFDYLHEHEFYDPSADSVTLLSMHAAKGLEFKYVYIIGFEEGIIPLTHQGTVENENEEKRLLYVAMTRAKQELHLLYTKERNKRNVVLSPFSKLLKSECISCIDDEAIGTIQKKRNEWKEKKSQLNLF